MRRGTRAFLSAMAGIFVVAGGLPLGSPAAVEAVSPHIVISQVYGGGGNTDAPYTHDFIELFNRSNVATTLNGWSVQYASATGTGNFGASATQLTELPDVTLAPGQYFLIQQGAGAGNGVALPTPDLIDGTPIAMAAGAGKVALATGTASLGCNGSTGQPCSAEALARIVDLVGYGNANFFEGSAAAPALSNTTAGFRAAGGCTDTDNNAADFSAAAPAPRNTASAFNPCPTGDAAPSVTSTVPADGDNGVAVDANISVTFSEPVDVSGAWFTIECTTSGSVAASASGGPTTFV
ncbi:MAG: lamin tail domain-containing protein, partial [Chloroflexota bacterium]|nr:lamin tail domain-containing protein [Chloroflexota bacterium]